MLPFVKASRKYKHIYSGRKKLVTACRQGVGTWRGVHGEVPQGGITRRYENTWEGIKYIHYFDCVDGFTIVCVCVMSKLSKLYPLII